MFFNLADNAACHNPKGTKFGVHLTSAEGRIAITIQDDGVGIPESAAHDIFKPFDRVDGVRNSETGGVGLGLSIERKIAKAHDGGLTLDQSVCSGCAFKLELPLI